MPLDRDIVAFKANFQEFKELPDADIAEVFNTADVFLDARVWPSARDFAMARKLWVAHTLLLYRMALASASFTGAGVGMSVDLYLSQIHIGERTVGLGQRRLMTSGGRGYVYGPGEEMLNTTIYGEMFIQLRTRNIPNVVLL